MDDELFSPADFAQLSGPPEVIERLAMVLTDAKAAVDEVAALLRQMHLRNQEVEARLANVEEMLGQHPVVELASDYLDQYEAARQAMLSVLIAPRENVQAQAEALLGIAAASASVIQLVHSTRFDQEWVRLQSES